ncbi:hypothetical protein FHR23_001518 [Stakelama sediminis]|uniref:Uncharacterized protein n=1 Tax=Stakelama sediminis TaxID=463200 RepID=A0A840YYA9_9SPHN|nr:hypothetical protein [Stakelama sediminis]
MEPALMQPCRIDEGAGTVGIRSKDSRGSQVGQRLIAALAILQRLFRQSLVGDIADIACGSGEMTVIIDKTLDACLNISPFSGGIFKTLFQQTLGNFSGYDFRINLFRGSEIVHVK